jgi:hypothetical protein
MPRSRDGEPGQREPLRIEQRGSPQLGPRAQCRAAMTKRTLDLDLAARLCRRSRCGGGAAGAGCHRYSARNGSAGGDGAHYNPQRAGVVGKAMQGYRLKRPTDRRLVAGMPQGRGICGADKARRDAVAASRPRDYVVDIVGVQARSRVSGASQRRRGVRPGVPDVMAVFCGRLIFIELKSRYGIASKAHGGRISFESFALAFQ